ncbi:MAG: hypothetical protein Q7R91_00305 [bacterium]|nr:hypothetical protein [bacterium]
MAYEVTPDPRPLPAPKKLRWESNKYGRGFPALAEIVMAANKEFPEVPFEELMVTASIGWDSELIWLKRKDI